MVPYDSYDETQAGHLDNAKWRWAGIVRWLDDHLPGWYPKTGRRSAGIMLGGAAHNALGALLEERDDLRKEAEKLRVEVNELRTYKHRFDEYKPDETKYGSYSPAAMETRVTSIIDALDRHFPDWFQGRFGPRPHSHHIGAELREWVERTAVRIQTLQKDDQERDVQSERIDALRRINAELQARVTELENQLRGGTPGDVQSLRQQREAWLAVTKQLSAGNARWVDRGASGEKAAVAEIAHLQEQANRQRQLDKTGAFATMYGTAVDFSAIESRVAACALPEVYSKCQPQGVNTAPPPRQPHPDAPVQHNDGTVSYPEWEKSYTKGVVRALATEQLSYSAFEPGRYTLQAAMDLLKDYHATQHEVYEGRDAARKAAKEMNDRLVNVEHECMSLQARLEVERRAFNNISKTLARRTDALGAAEDAIQAALDVVQQAP